MDKGSKGGSARAFWTAAAAVAAADRALKIAAFRLPAEGVVLIPGVLRLSGSMDELKGLEDILRVAKNAGAKKVLLPFSCIKDLQDVSQELLGSVSPDFYPDGDAVAAARKALGI